MKTKRTLLITVVTLSIMAAAFLFRKSREMPVAKKPVAVCGKVNN